jgi:hypothetical protein
MPRCLPLRGISLVYIALSPWIVLAFADEGLFLRIHNMQNSITAFMWWTENFERISHGERKWLRKEELILDLNEVERKVS